MNFTAPYLLIILSYYTSITIANALLSANKYGTIPFNIPWWAFIAGYFVYLLFEHINQYIRENYKNN